MQLLQVTRSNITDHATTFLCLFKLIDANILLLFLYQYLFKLFCSKMYKKQEAHLMEYLRTEMDG